MSLSAADKERFLAALRSDDEFRQQVRRQLLTDELLGLPARFDAFIAEMHAFVEEMRASREAANGRLDRLEHDSARLWGIMLGQRVAGNPGYYLSGYARRVRKVSIDDLLDDLGLADLSGEEYERLARTDVLALGRSKENGEKVALVVEATWRVHSGDIDRQVARREVLSRRGVTTLAVVAAEEEASTAVRGRAQAAGIALEHAPEPAA
jgi:hypothetical protein